MSLMVDTGAGFSRLRIAGAVAIVLAACVVLVNRGRWRTILIAGLVCALVANSVESARTRGGGARNRERRQLW